MLGMTLLTKIAMVSPPKLTDLSDVGPSTPSDYTNNLLDILIV